jgi:putative endonuclease
MVRCSDDTYYTGITDDIPRRLAEHNGDSPGGAAYTQSRRPVVLAYSEVAADRSAALRREYQIKQFPRGEKLRLIEAASAPSPQSKK